MNLRETYNKIAEDWIKDHQSDDWWTPGTEAFLKLLKPGDSILDVGCAGGTRSTYLLEKGYQVTGIDFSEKFIEIARRDVPEGTFHVMDMRNAGTLETKFHGIYVQASLLHIPKREAEDTLKVLYSKLDLGGYMYVAVKGRRDGEPDEAVKEERGYGYSYRRFFSYYSMNELKEYFKNIGLSVVYTKENLVGKTQWLQIVGARNN